MTTIKNFPFNYSDLTFMREQINFRPLFDANGKPIVNWDGKTAIHDAAGNQLYSGTGMTPEAAIAQYGISYPTYTSSVGLRDIDGLNNNLFDTTWGNSDLPFLQRTQVIFDNYVKPLEATDPNAFYALQFATSPNPTTADYTKIGDNLATPDVDETHAVQTVVDYTPRMISRTVTTGGVTFETEVGSTHQIKDANGYTAIADYGLLQGLGQQDGQRAVEVNGDIGAGGFVTNDINGAALDNQEYFIGGTNPGVAPVNGWFALFGQFFDHGLDFVGKGADGTKITINLSPDDPMYGVIDPTTGRPATKIVISRADVSGFTADGTPQWVNHTSPYIDQSQTYGSHEQMTNLLREWVPTDPANPTTYRMGAGMFDGHTSAQWEDGFGNLTNRTLPTLNELRAHLVATGRDDLSWEDVSNLRNRDASGHVIDSNAGTPGVQGAGSGAALLLDSNPRFTEAHLHDGDAGQDAAVDAAITFLGTQVRPGDTFGLASGGSLSLTLGSDFVAGPTTIPAGTVLTGASALMLWVDFSNFAIMAPPSGTIANPAGDVHDAVSAILMASVGNHYIAGDGRTNENIGLTAVHHVFHEEHNYQVENIKQSIVKLDAREGALDQTNTYSHALLHEWQVNTGTTDAAGNYVYANGDVAWNDDMIFNAAKMTVEMEYQHTAVDQFARTITPNLHEFVGYNSGENATISLDFAQVAYRFGHSTLRESIDLMDPNGSITDSIMRVALERAFLSPEKFAAVGAGAIALGMTHQQANEVDEFLTPALNQGLLGLPLDLATINIARGRDLGVPTLNDMREALQLSTYTSWADFGANMLHPESLVNFIAAYAFDGNVARAQAILGLADDSILVGSPEAMGYTVQQAVDFLNNTDPSIYGCDAFNQIDCWIGGLAEVHVTGGLLGETFDTIFVDQIGRVMDGDRFYYLQRLNNVPYGQQIIDEQFKDIIERTTGARHLNGSAFAYADQYFDLAAVADATADIASATAARDAALTAYVAAGVARAAADQAAVAAAADLAAAEAAALSDAVALRDAANVAQDNANTINTTAELNALLAALALANGSDAAALQAAAAAAQATADATDAAALQNDATTALNHDIAAAAAQATALLSGDAAALQLAADNAAADDLAAANAVIAAADAAQAEADALVALNTATTALNDLITSGAAQVDIDAQQLVVDAATITYNDAVVASDNADQAVIDTQAVADATDAPVLQDAATQAALDDAAAAAAQLLADATDAPALQTAADQAVLDDDAAATAQALAAAAVAADAGVMPALNAYVVAAAADEAADAAAASADADADAAEAADAALALAASAAASATNAATVATAGEAAALAALNAAQAALTALETEGNGKTQHRYAAQLAANPNLGIFSDGGTTTALNGNVVTVGGKQYIRDARTPSADTVAGNAAGFALDGAPNSGAESHEVIVASNRDDLIYARGGDDTVYGEVGNDIINGGNGIDRLYGGAGADTIYGGDGGDLIDGGDGDDVLWGEQNATAAAGLDQVIGSAGNDYIDGAIGIDKLSGSEGDDVIFGGGDTDAFTHGGEGNDYIDGGVTGDLLWGDNGDDLIAGQADQDIVAGMEGDDILRPGPLSQSLTGGGDEVIGGDGRSDAGNDGKGVGFDLIDLSDWQAAPKGATIDFSTQGNPLVAIDGAPQFPAWAQIEGAIGSRNNDTFLADANNNWLIGGSGNDAITGGGGNDLIVGDGIRLDQLIGTYDSSYNLYFDGASHRAFGYTDEAETAGLDRNFLQHNGILDAVGWGDQKHLTEMLKSAMFKDMVLGGSEITKIWRNGVAQTTGESAGQIGDGGVAGASDVVTYSGLVSDYVVSRVLFDTATRSIVSSASPTTIEVAKVHDNVAGRDGEDLVLGVETFRFSDGNGGFREFTLAQLDQKPATGAAIVNDTTPTEGQTLSVNTASIADANGIASLTIEWQSSADGLTGWTTVGTGATLALPDAAGAATTPLWGQYLKSVVTVVDNLGGPLSTTVIESAVTDRVGQRFSTNVAATFTGPDTNDTVIGSGGNDILNGAWGNDLVQGGGGNDVLRGGRGNDVVEGQGGNDTVAWMYPVAGYTFTTVGNTANLLVIDNVALSGTDEVRTSEFLQFTDGTWAVTTGTNANNTLGVAGTGSQALFGRNGADTLNGNAGRDILVGGAGNDTVNGGDDDDFIYQVGSTDGRDFIDGGNGIDTYTLSGVAGAETFDIYARLAAQTAGITINNANTEIVITRNGVVIAELDNIEEIRVSSLLTQGEVLPTDQNGNGTVDPGTLDGDTVNIIGNFAAPFTSLQYNTIRVNGSNANDTVNISGLASDHRVVFTTNGGSDTIVGAVRDQDIVNGAVTDLRTSGFGAQDGLDAMVGSQVQTADLGRYFDSAHLDASIDRTMIAADEHLLPLDFADTGGTIAPDFHHAAVDLREFNHRGIYSDHAVLF